MIIIIKGINSIIQLLCEILLRNGGKNYGACQKEN